MVPINPDEPFGDIKKGVIHLLSNAYKTREKREDLGRKTICSNNTNLANPLNIWVDVH